MFPLFAYVPLTLRINVSRLLGRTKLAHGLLSGKYSVPALEVRTIWLYYVLCSFTFLFCLSCFFFWYFLTERWCWEHSNFNKWCKLSFRAFRSFESIINLGIFGILDKWIWGYLELWIAVLICWWMIWHGFSEDMEIFVLTWIVFLAYLRAYMHNYEVNDFLTLLGLDLY